MQDALSLISDWVYHWRSLFEESDPITVYIKGIHNGVVDAISQLYNWPITDDRSTRMTFAQFWWFHNSAHEHNESMASTKESMNLVFANQNEEDSIYPLTTREIAKAQQQDSDLKEQADKEGFSTQLVKNIQVLCKDSKMVTL